MALPPAPPVRSPTLAYVPLIPPSQRTFVIVGTLIASTLILLLVTFVGKRSIAIGLPIFVVMDAVLVAFALRGGISIGRDWLRIERLIGATSLDLTQLRKIRVQRSMQGVNLEIEDERGKSADLPLEQLQRSPEVWKTLRRALKGAMNRGVSIDARSRATLDL